jgi:Ca2+-binding EF-hand superfamily protein
VDLWEFCVYLHRSLIEHKSDIAVIHEDEWKLEMSLELFDANKDGFITVDELARIMQDGHSADPNPNPHPPNPTLTLTQP